MKYLLAFLLLLALQETYLGPPQVRWDCDFDKAKLNWIVIDCPICKKAEYWDEMKEDTWDTWPTSRHPIRRARLDSIYLACKTLHRTPPHPKYLTLRRLSPFTNIEDCREHCEVEPVNGTCIEASELTPDMKEKFGQSQPYSGTEIGTSHGNKQGRTKK